jgi:hypothetical protein
MSTALRWAVNISGLPAISLPGGKPIGTVSDDDEGRGGYEQLLCQYTGVCGYGPDHPAAFEYDS